MGGVHSDGLGSIFLYIGGGGAAHYMGEESTKLGYIEGVLPQTPPTIWDILHDVTLDT